MFFLFLLIVNCRNQEGEAKNTQVQINSSNSPRKELE